MWNLWLRSHLSSASGLRNKTRTSLRLYLLPLLRLSLLPDPLILLCPRFSYTCTVGTGISACYPSPTPLGLSLGPDLPWADEPSPGNLRLSMAWILTTLSLLIPAFSLLLRPAVLSVYLRPTIECSSTTHIFLCESAISVYSLAPVIFRATSLDQ